MAVASSASSDRTNRRGLDSPLTAVNATRRPLGEATGAESSPVPGGSDQVKRVSVWGIAWSDVRPPRDQPKMATRTVATPTAAAIVQPLRVPGNRLVAA